MHSEGASDPRANPPGQMPATDDEIKEKYLERAIRELNAFSRELLECPHCPRGNFTPVQGSGHPQADVFLLKHAPRPAEIEEGVAFYGRSGNAVMKSLARLGIDPLTVYGTLCVKCPVPDVALADPACIARIAEEIAIVRPRIVVAMGEWAVSALNDAGVPLAQEVEFVPGARRALTPTIEVLVTPDIDASLDDDESKRAFWSAFKALGDWYAELPPY